jgi:hypothetical protein
MLFDLEKKAAVVTPGGRVGDNSRHGSRANGENWIEKSPDGELPEYIRTVRNGLMRENPSWSEGRATATAINAIKRWARGGDDVKPAVRAAAVAALAKWEAMKGEKSIDQRVSELKSRRSVRPGERERPVSTDRLETHRRLSDNRHGTERAASPDRAPQKRSAGARANSAGLPPAWQRRLPLKQGAQGNMVRALQEVINVIPDTPSLVPDGKYGPKTSAAVGEMQKLSGLESTGELDEQTFKAIVGFRRKKKGAKK